MILPALALIAPLTQQKVTPLESLPLTAWRQGFSMPQVGKSVSKKPITVAGSTYPVGIGSHAPGGLRLALDGRTTRVRGSVGVDDAGGGSVVFEIWVDGRRRWNSGIVRKRQAPVPFDVDLTRAKEVLLVMGDGGDSSGGDHADWIDVRFFHEGATPRPVPYMKTFTLRPEKARQTIDNFAASDSWTIEPLYRWPESDRKKIATLLFDREKGIGLSGWRHNLGGGINHETITMPLRTVQTYEVSEGKYDWNRNPGKRWMLKAARDAGVENIVAYAVSPPARLTRNGFTNGTDGSGTTNLKPGAEGAYARYLADIVEHYRNQGYRFTHISPVNEPDFEWNGVPNPATQEGNRASNADILSISKAVFAEIQRRKLPVRILTPEANSPQVGYERNENMSKKYGADYGNYTALFAKEEEWRRTVQPIYAYHSYWSDGLSQIVPFRQRLRAELDKSPGLRVWQTEFCQMAGPRGEGGWGRDLGMTLALNVARLIHFDLTLVEASAWQWWLAVSNSDYKDGLVYVDDLDGAKGTIYPSKTLWTVGHFSRFIRPGYQRIEVEGPQSDVAGLLVSAYRDSKTGRIVVVAINTETESETMNFSLPTGLSVQPYLTSDRAGDDLRALPKWKTGAPITVPSRSVMSFVCDPLK